MNGKKKKMIKYFEKEGGIVRFSALLKAGFHPDTLKALQKEGEVKKSARGIYQLVHYALGPYPDFILASVQAQKGIICLLSALYYHEITNEIPGCVDMAIPAGSRASKVEYPPIRFYHFSDKTFKAGTEVHKIGKHEIKMYSPAKTIADCFKFRNRIGVNIARDALKAAVSEGKAKPGEIMEYAKICRVNKIIKPVLETLL